MTLIDKLTPLENLLAAVAVALFALHVTGLDQALHVYAWLAANVPLLFATRGG